MAIFKPNRDRVRIFALSILVLCCAGFIGGMFYLQHQAANSPVANFTHTPDPQLVAETEQHKKEKILELRDKWQVWAKAHQPELRAMLKAQPNDTAALTRVTDALPAFPDPETTGITSEDLSGIQNDSDPVIFSVSYDHVVKALVPNERASESEVEKMKDMVRQRDQVAFGQLRDVIVVSISSAWSDKNYCLWASGRATESKHIHPDPSLSYNTVAPSYNFLSS